MANFTFSKEHTNLLYKIRDNTIIIISNKQKKNLHVLAAGSVYDFTIFVLKLTKKSAE